MRFAICKSMSLHLGLWVGLYLLGLSLLPAFAQFSSGSTGGNGAFPPVAVPDGTTAMTLDLRTGVLTFFPGGTTPVIPNTPADGFADGVLNFTTMSVPAGVTLRFIRNLANTPVTILLQGDALIAGVIDVSGESGQASNGSVAGRGGQGGPGGFKGGNGELVFSSPGAGAGLGAGGGRGGGPLDDTNGGGGGGGGFGTAGANGIGTPGNSGGVTYGTPTSLPLLGGSGGGGGSSHTEAGPPGGGGGGGGGAFLMASSATIQVVAGGGIAANGGNGGNPIGGANAGGGGGGSGGAIRLIADVISGGGGISANGGTRGAGNGRDGGAGGLGRVRLEAFTLSFNGQIVGSPSSVAPGLVFIPNTPMVRIASVDGVATPDVPQGSIGGVDVVVDSPGTITVTLEAMRVPLGTTIAVIAKPETDAEVIGPVTSAALAGTFDTATATAELTFPAAGVFFIEARATFAVP